MSESEKILPLSFQSNEVSAYRPKKYQGQRKALMS
jgi:hypothetical protein